MTPLPGQIAVGGLVPAVSGQVAPDQGIRTENLANSSETDSRGPLRTPQPGLVGTSGATLEKTGYQEREHEKSDARAKADDAKDQTCKGDAATTESAKAGGDPPVGNETHDRRPGTEQKPEPEENE